MLIAERINEVVIENTGKVTYNYRKPFVGLKKKRNLSGMLF